MDLINQFIDNYKKKFNYYESVGRLAAGQLEAVLRSSGIRAMVTYRAKNPGRLKSKVLHRNAKRPVPYRNIKEIYEDIADLCGVRVSLYFPGDRLQADQLIRISSTFWKASSSRSSQSLLLIISVFPATGPTTTVSI